MHDEDAGPPHALPAALAVGAARFTVLSPALIRLEWSPAGRFEDRATLAFPDRDARVGDCRFMLRTLDGDATDTDRFASVGGELETADLVLRYDPAAAPGGAFTGQSLSIRLKNAPRTTWRPGSDDAANLGGTRRTLDHISGAAPLENGLLSRDGWAIYDDSHMPVLAPPTLGRSDWRGEPWAHARDAHPDAIDWCFFGYGRDYTRALREYTQLAGRIPLPPRYTLGVWWSRYWRYHDHELKDIVTDFDRHGVPLDVLVIDMDWHLTGWTGYTWNRELFPDPRGFLSWCHDRGLFVTLNLHPADGVGKHEAHFNAMRAAVNGDRTMYRVPFDCTDPVYMSAYFDILHRPLEREGVDFWWMDWQQGGDSLIKNLDPLPWLNHLHWRDMELNSDRAIDRVGAAHHRPHDHTPGRTDRDDDHVDACRKGAALRPLILSRWGGLGGHRYPVGFSGDTFNDWASLAFQPRFTATASNVGFGYWSHDIGGHQPGPVEPELYGRWMQYSVFSPIVRTHAGKNPQAERRLWMFPQRTFDVAKGALRLRYALLPYIYGMNRAAFDTGVSLCRPMYYAWPEHDAAYHADAQFMFGDDLLVAPVVAPADPDSALAGSRVWLPPGEWTHWFTGRTHRVDEPEGRRVSVVSMADELPLFARTGAVVPTTLPAARVYEGAAREIILYIFPGERGETWLYDDDGLTDDYQRGRCAWTHVRHDTHDGHSPQRRVHIGPAVAGPSPQEARTLAADGGVRDFPRFRHYEVRLRSVLDATHVEADGEPLDRLDHSPHGRVRRGFYYDSTTHTLAIVLPESSTARGVDLTIHHAHDEDALRQVRGGDTERQRRARAFTGDADPGVDEHDNSPADEHDTPGSFLRRLGVATQITATGADDGSIDVRLELHRDRSFTPDANVVVRATTQQLTCFGFTTNPIDVDGQSLASDDAIVRTARLVALDTSPGNDALCVDVTIDADGVPCTIRRRIELCPSINVWRLDPPAPVGRDETLDVTTARLERWDDAASNAPAAVDVHRPPLAAVSAPFVCDLNQYLGSPFTPRATRARTMILAEADTPAWLELNVDGTVAVAVNGERVFHDPSPRRFGTGALADGADAAGAARLAINLRRGRNDIDIILVNTGEAWRLSASIRDRHGDVIPGLRSSTKTASGRTARDA
jgi:alpha-glucosidase